MEQVIYYFSGTGNCLYAARCLAEMLDARLQPISATRDAQAVETGAQRIGIVFPVHYGDAPVAVREFIGKLSDLREKQVFAVCTHGGAAGDSLHTVRRLLEQNGGTLSLAFGVPMPQNSFDKWYENRARRLALCNRRCVRIAKRIQRGATGIRYHNPLLEWMMIPVMRIMIKPACRLYFMKNSGLDKSATEAEMIRSLDRGFTTLDTCTGCGVCARVCPAGNIELADGRPVWQHRCDNCLACYNWCPKQAITGGIAKSGYYYRHPKVAAKDFFGT